MAEAKSLLERSFFQRVLENLRVEPILLDTQYRMHPALIEFPSKTFYDDRLKTGVEPEARRPPTEIRFDHPEKPLWFVDVATGREFLRGCNISNREEAELVCQTIVTLLPKEKPNFSP